MDDDLFEELLQTRGCDFAIRAGLSGLAMAPNGREHCVVDFVTACRQFGIARVVSAMTKWGLLQKDLDKKDFCFGLIDEVVKRATPQIVNLG